MIADADVVSIVIEALQSIGLPNFVVHINHRKLLESFAIYAGVPGERAGSVYRAIDKLAKIGEGGVVAELEAGGVAPDAARRIVELVSTSGPPDVVMSAVAERLEGIDLAREALRDLGELFNYLAALGAPAMHYEFDLALARGLEYYTGPVFETTVDEPKIGSLGGAGRYDGLVGMFSGQDIPATGMSLGLDRIIDVAEELELLRFDTTVSQALVTVFDTAHIEQSLAAAARLRAAGLRAEVYTEEGRNLGRQHQHAERRGIPYSVVIGPDEVERGEAVVRDIRSRDQVSVPFDGLANWLLDRLSSR
jgi:histidyl-tRNA synthetase